MNIFFIISVIIHTIQNKRISVLKDSIRPNIITNTGNDERYIFPSTIDEIDISTIHMNHYKMKSILFLESPAYTEAAKLRHIQHLESDSDNCTYKPFSCWTESDFSEMILFGLFI